MVVLLANALEPIIEIFYSILHMYVRTERVANVDDTLGEQFLADIEPSKADLMVRKINIISSDVLTFELPYILL